jgi:outer membrane protein
MYRRFAVFAAAGGLALSIGSGVASAAGVTLPGEAQTIHPAGVAPLSTDWRFTVGLGAGLAPDYEGSKDYVFVPIPTFRAAKGYTDYALNGTTFRSNMINHPNWRFGPYVRYIKERDYVKDRPVSDVNIADASLQFGLIGGYEFHIEQVPFKSTIGVMAEGGYDVLNGNGWTLTPEINWGIPVTSRLSMRLGVDATVASGDYMGNYFNVSGPQFRKNPRIGSTYKAGSTQLYKAGVSLGTSYAITEHWGVSGIASYHQLVNDAADSPITKRGSKHQGFAGISGTYSW